MLSLNGTLVLPNNFVDTMPVFLAGSTLLQTGGAATFNAPITGGGNTLTLAGGGSFAFNGPVGLGAGTFSLQQGAASINAGLSAASVSVGAQGTLTNSAGSTIVGAVANAGAFNNNGVVSGSVSNQGIARRHRHDRGQRVQFRRDLAGQLHRHHDHRRHLHPGRRQLLPGRGERLGPERPINVGGPATLQGGTVNVVGRAGQHLRCAHHLHHPECNGGVSGPYAAVNELYPFLLSSLSYDANNVYLTLQPGGFAAAAQTRTQYAVGAVLDANVSNASGDFATIAGHACRSAEPARSCPS